MPGLVPGIHALLTEMQQGVDGRDKPGHDELMGLYRNKRRANRTRIARATKQSRPSARGFWIASSLRSSQ